MPKWLDQALRDGHARLERHADQIGIANVDEFTFRAFVMASITEQCPDARLQSEWRKFDLLVQAPTETHLIEFKCYVLRRTINLDGTPGTWKGSAGPKNEGEFWKNIQKLQQAQLPPIDGRHMVLCYEHSPTRRSRYSFEMSYGSIKPGQAIREVRRFDSAHTSCLWLTVR